MKTLQHWKFLIRTAPIYPGLFQNVRRNQPKFKVISFETDSAIKHLKFNTPNFVFLISKNRLKYKSSTLYIMIYRNIKIKHLYQHILSMFCDLIHALGPPHFISTNQIKKNYLQAEYSTAKQHHKNCKNYNSNFITISITIVTALWAMAR